MRVPLPTICLKVVMELMVLSSTISLQVFASTPVVSNSDVVAMTGYLLSGSIKLSSSALPSRLSPVIRITYLLFSMANCPAALTMALRMRSAWSISSQNMMVFWYGSVARNNFMTRSATSFVRLFNTNMRSISAWLYSRCSSSLPKSSFIPFGGVQPWMSLSISIRTTL